MGTRRVWRGWLGWALLWAGLVGLAAGQSVEMRPVQHLLPGALPTVSVATLRMPEKAWTHFERARDAMQANRTEEFERETAKALEVAPNFAAVYLLRAIHEVSGHQFDTAIADVEQAQRAEPGVAWAGVILAGAYNGAHRWADAVVVLENLQGAEADTWQAGYERARAAIGRRDAEGALHWSEQAVAMAPANYAEVHLLRAHALSLAGRWPAAIAEMETYLATAQPHRAEVLAMLEQARRLVPADDAFASR
jgi:tetratricopeptide (TPR) repeat protein